MNQKIKDNAHFLTPQEFEEAMEGMAAYQLIKQEKAKLRTLLDCLSEADIRADLQEYEAWHTVGGKPASEETYRVLSAELIRRGPYGALLNSNNRTNQKIL